MLRAYSYCFGSRAVRWAMLLPWLALVGIVASRFNPANGDRSNRAPSGVGVVFALVVASCPVLLSLTPSLMQDTFVCLVAVLFAIICMWGKNPEGLPFWAAVGGTAGLAWTSKFTLLAYVAPLVVCAIYRCKKVDTWRTLVQSLPLAALAFVVSAGPWLWHSYRQSGNPVFPFFLSVLPAPSWPNGLGKMNLDNFRLPGGVRGWLFSPIDMTYSTSRFAEGTDGYLGLVIPVILIASILIVRKGTARTQDAGDLRCFRYSSVVDSDGLHPLLAAWHLDTGFGRQLHMSTNTVARLALYPNPGSARLVSRLVSATYQAR